MTERTKRKILKLHEQGYAAKGIAMATGCTEREAEGVIKNKWRETPTRDREAEELARAATDLIARGYDPDVVRANFGKG